MEKQESQQIKDKNEILGQAINTCLEMELAFKLYSFRVVETQMFIARVKDLCDYFAELAKDENVSNLKKVEDE